MDIQLTDLLADYPSQSEPLIQTLISAKKEFAELASSESESLPAKGDFFRHQKLVHRFMRVYNDIFLIHDTGTGKTCTMGGIAEYFETHRGTIRQVYVLVSGDTLIDEFKRQIACVCTNRKYETERSLTAITQSAQKAEITRQINKWYKIMTYHSFYNEVMRAVEGTQTHREANSNIRDKFSNSIFFIDEIQNIKVDPYNRQPTQKKDVTGTRNEQRRRNAVFSAIWRVFHLADRSKRVIASATPMTNTVEEIGPSLNLLLPLDKQIDNEFTRTLPELTGVQFTGPLINIDFDTVTVEDLEPLLRGKISYVRGSRTGAVPNYVGTTVGTTMTELGEVHKSKLNLDLSVMEGIQLRAYLEALNQKVEAFSHKIREIMNFVFPNGKTWKEGGKERYVAEDVQGTATSRKKVYRAKPELVQALRDPNTLRQLSTKMYKIMTSIIHDPGIHYMYSHLVKGGGTVIMGFILEAYGFERFQYRTSVFQSTTQTIRPFCATTNTVKDRTLQIEKKNRYASISMDTPSTERAAIFELLNSPENAEGEYIKAILLSPVAQFGINLANIQNVHILESSWSPSAVYQATNRAFRATSHIDLLQKKKIQLLAEGKSIDKVNIDVKVHLHSTVTQEYDIPTGRVVHRPSKEYRMWIYSENKDIKIHRMMRILKRIAVDCQIHYNRNVRADDINGSAVCDYTECAYQCFNPLPEVMGGDTSTYDIYYIDELLDEVIKGIRLYFRHSSSATIENLREFMSIVSKDRYFYFALERMITKNMPVTDRYGYTSYIKEDRDTFYLTRTYPRIYPIRDKSSSYYSENLIGLQTKKLKDINLKFRAEESVQVEAEIREISPESTQFTEFIYNTPIETVYSFLEKAITNTLKNQQTDHDKRTIEYFRTSIFPSYEPVKEIQSQINKTGKGKGKALTIKCTSEVGKDSTQEQVWMHNLLTCSSEGARYGRMSQYFNAKGRIRIYKPSEGIWRDASLNEAPAYSCIIQNQLSIRFNKFLTEINQRGYNIYGVTIGGEFLIADKRQEGSQAVGDRRHKVNGRNCGNIDKDKLIDIMYDLGLRTIGSQTGYGKEVSYLYNLERSEKIAFLFKKRVKFDLESFDEEKLNFFVAWYKITGNAIKKSMLCLRIALFMLNHPQGSLIFPTFGDPKTQISIMLKNSKTKESILRSIVYNYGSEDDRRLLGMTSQNSLTSVPDPSGASSSSTQY